MAVPENERSGNKLQVLNLSAQLLHYTYAKTQKPKSKIDPKEGGCFPRSALRLANQIWDLCYYGDSCLNMANDYIVHTLADYKVRRKLQLKGRGYIMHLPRLLMLAFSENLISAKNLDFWCKIVYETLDLAGKWIESDEKRYKDIGC